MIYLDNASSTRVLEEVNNVITLCNLENYFNASSNHIGGRTVNHNIEQAREQVANLINSNDSEIVFNSGSTEGINTVLKGLVEANIERGNHIITTKVEHKAVLETCAYLENIGIDITYLDVDESGLISIEELKEAIREDTLLVSILWVNNETGVVQDIKRVGEIVLKTNAKLFVDSTQVVGKMKVDVKAMNIDMLCLSGHKFHGPKGIGALYISEGVKVAPLLYGGGQENSLRAGTYNVAGIVGLAKACEISVINDVIVKDVITYLEKKLKENFDCKVIGSSKNRSPYILNVIIKGVDSDVVIAKLKNTILSSGSACNSRIVEPSYVLQNMGYSDEDNFSSLRFSISRFTKIEEIDIAINDLKEVIN